MAIEQINQLKQGSIISESSHYIVNRVSGSNAWLTHFESGEEVQVGMSYLKNYTNSADLFETTVKVTKEDKKENYIRKERHYGEVSRSFYVGNIDKSAISAKFENGVLEVTLPKQEKSINEDNKIKIE